MKRTFFSLLLLLVTLVAQAQPNFKLYYANNVGDVAHLSRIKATDSGLKWKEIRNGDIAGNRTDVEAVKKMFNETRQKTRDDQELFWKMRDDNLLCFRIKVNRKGCGPNDTLQFKYYIYDWGNDDLITFKLDSRRSNSGLTYQLEYATEDIKGTQRETHTLNLTGKSFQSFYRPADKDVKGIWLVSNGNRLKLDMKRLMWGANLSNKLNRLWMGTNFTLDKHKDRELTIFNMLGSGLFEKYDTLYLQIMGKNGPVKADADPQTKLAKGFSFNIVEVDGNGKYKKTEGLQMKYAGYDQKNGIHKILTYGNPCYMEVYAPGYYPALYKYPGALDSKKELSKDRTFGTLRMITGTTTASGPNISSHFLHVLKDENID